jgi:hypothetical protein
MLDLENVKKCLGLLDLKEGFERSKKVNLCLREVRCGFSRWCRGLLDLKEVRENCQNERRFVLSGKGV